MGPFPGLKLCEGVPQEVGAAISSVLVKADLVQEQACFLPLSPDGVPAIGALPGTANSVYVASGKSRSTFHCRARQGGSCLFTTPCMLFIILMSRSEETWWSIPSWLFSRAGGVIRVSTDGHNFCRAQLLGYFECASNRGGRG